MASARGTKSNSIKVALLVTPGFKLSRAFSRSASPSHPTAPSLNSTVLGPPARPAFPVVNIIPSVNGNETPSPEKYPIPLLDPKSVPVDEIKLDTLTQGLLIKTSSISWVGVYVT